MRSAVSTVLRGQNLGDLDRVGRSIVDRAICSEPLARGYGDWMRFVLLLYGSAPCAVDQW